NTSADSGFRAALRRHRLQKVHTPGDFRAVAQKRLPKMVFDYIDGGAGQELSIRENRAAIEEIRLVPSAPHDVSACDMSVSLFGETLSLPIIIGPTGLASASWPKGEIEFAKAATRH